MSSRPESIPLPAVRRLSLYLRQLEALAREGTGTISSKGLGRALGLRDAQVRKDLAYFGQFGHPGIGYRVDEVIQRVRHILGTDKTWHAALAGVRGILNFAPTALTVPETVAVSSVDLAVQLEQLSFKVNSMRRAALRSTGEAAK